MRNCLSLRFRLPICFLKLLCLRIFNLLFEPFIYSNFRTDETTQRILRKTLQMRSYYLFFVQRIFTEFSNELSLIVCILGLFNSFRIISWKLLWVRPLIEKKNTCTHFIFSISFAFDIVILHIFYLSQLFYFAFAYVTK